MGLELTDACITVVLSCGCMMVCKALLTEQTGDELALGRVDQVHEIARDDLAVLLY